MRHQSQTLYVNVFTVKTLYIKFNFKTAKVAAVERRSA